MKAIRVHTPGPEENLVLEDVAIPQPGPGQALVKIEASGVNFIDIYFRTGLYPTPEKPFGLGMEAAGTVVEVGPDTEHVKAGDRVAYAMQRGSYAEYAVVPSWMLVPVPAALDLPTAAALMLKGYEEKSGHPIIATTYYGVRHTTSNKPIAKCADMKGLKIRVPDVPAYLAMPRACGANTSPIAFAEVYLALQNGTVEAQENPLTTIEAKKFYEVQKNIVLTGHIVDHLNTIVAGGLWKKLSDADKKMFTDVAQEAAAKASGEVAAREKELVAVFKGKGLNVVEVDKEDFRSTVLKNVTFESFGYQKADWDKIQAIK